MTGGALLPDTFYRGATPANNVNKRAGVTNELLERHGIRYIMNLSDTEERLKTYMTDKDFSSDYFEKLYNDGNVSVLGMTSSYRTEDFKSSLVRGLREMQQNEGPYYIHCLEGKDRTGFVCMLLEALSGASYDELADDYMLTYKNYYGITKESDPERYQTILEVKFYDMVLCLSDSMNDDDVKNLDYKEGAINYLLDSGMSKNEVDSLIQFRYMSIILLISLTNFLKYFSQMCNHAIINVAL